MSNAVVLHVKLSLDDEPEAAEAMLKELVVPNAKAQPGFESGTWMRNGEDGLGVVVFDTPENAAAAVAALTPPPGGPELISSAVYEVGAEA